MSCTFQGLAGVYEAPGEDPLAVCGFDAASKEQQFAVLPDDGAGGDSGVQVLDEAAGLADEALGFAFLYQLEFEVSSATNAEFVAGVSVIVGHGVVMKRAELGSG